MKSLLGALVSLSVYVAPLLNASEFALGSDVKERYADMAPIEAYLMDRNQEIALARSAAPTSISRDATILVLTRTGYETAVKGSNGFVCMVERGWVGALDWPEMWNQKVRGADCLNQLAARTILPLAEIRTEMFLAGRSTADVIAKIQNSFSSKQVPRLEPGAMSYMMSKQSYLTDAGDHNMPHLMFYVSTRDSTSWGAGSRGSPVGAGGYWFFSKARVRATDTLPPIRVFTVDVGTWSDGSPAPAMRGM